nr:hypothetical protein CFP56_53640 [Quercus suber]
MRKGGGRPCIAQRGGSLLCGVFGCRTGGIFAVFNPNHFFHQVPRAQWLEAGEGGAGNAHSVTHHYVALPCGSPNNR